MADPTDTVGRFRELLQSVRPTPPAALSPTTLKSVIDQKPPNESIEGVLAKHVALNSPLTEEAATAVVTEALPDGGNDQEKAKAVSAAVAPAVSGEIELSDPVMLWPWMRGAFAVVLAAALFLAISLVYGLVDPKSDAPNAAYISLGILAGLSLIGLLVLVMGYKTVTIKGGTGSG